jgi:hypothetical protein
VGGDGTTEGAKTALDMKPQIELLTREIRQLTVEKDSHVQTHQNVSKEKWRQFFEVENAESLSALLTFLQVTNELQKHVIRHMDAASLNSTAGASSLTTPPSLQKNWTQCRQSLLNVLQTSPHATEI